LKSIPEIICEQWPPANWLAHSVLVAVSGGPDSVALLRALRRIHEQQNGTGTLIVGHVDHQLRKGESRADAEFVADIATRLQLRFELRMADAPHESAGGRSVEGILRQRRYELLGQIARETGCRYLCTGHQADDQAETVLFRILRGTGIGGLRGIPPRRVLDDSITICRPMLGVRRQQLLDWLQELGQPWRTDSSNQTGSFARSRIRNELLPEIRELMSCDPVDALCDVAVSAAEIHDFLDQQTERFCGSLIKIGRGQIDVDLNIAAKESDFLIRHGLRRAWAGMGWPSGQMTRERWLRVASILTSGPATEKFAEDLPDGIRMLVAGTTASFQRTSGK
jgi:tRNA(Ile)-lysidine synthase